MSFHFPPRISGGVFRPGKIYKYLDKSLYEIDFVTHSLGGHFKNAVLDQTLIDELDPPPMIRRLPHIDPHLVLRGLVERERRGHSARASAESNGHAVAAAKRPRHELSKGSPRMGVMNRLYHRWIMAVYFPDQFFLWGWLAAVRSLILHAKRRYDVIYTTSYPESGHLAGFLLKKLGVKWVADYRYAGGLWNKKMLSYVKTPRREAREFRFQKRVIEQADEVIVQSDVIKRDFSAAFEVPEDRMVTISSGFDESDFVRTDDRGSLPESSRDGVSILHVGSWYLDDAQIRELIRRLNALDDALSPRKIELHAVGNDLFDDTQKQLARFRYVYHGAVEHTELPSFLVAADSFLLSTMITTTGPVADREYLPGKLWEYLRGGKPILFIGPKSEAWSKVERAGVGHYLGCLDEELDIEPGIFLDPTAQGVPLHPSVHSYSWESRAKAFDRVFQRALA